MSFFLILDSQISSVIYTFMFTKTLFFTFVWTDKVLVRRSVNVVGHPRGQWHWQDPECEK